MNVADDGDADASELPTRSPRTRHSEAITPMPSPSARAPQRGRFRLSVGALVAATLAAACNEPTLPLSHTPAIALRAQSATGVLPNGVPYGIGGAYTLNVSGPYVTARDPSPSGITLIPGIPVEVVVSGQITRQMTDGFQAHCDLLPFTCPDFVRSNAPFGPGGLDGTNLGAATSWWDNFFGFYYYVSPGGSVVYRGLSGTNLLLGRTGLYCSWGHVFPDGTVEEGDCYTMGGGFTYTVRALPTPAGQAGLTLAITNNALGPDGGLVDLASATTDGSEATNLTWYFIADHVSEETDPAPSVMAMAAASTLRAPAGASRSLGAARAPNAGAGRAPAAGRRVRAINGATGDTTITTDISTLPAGDYLFLSADSAGVGVAGANLVAFGAPSAAASRMAPSARMSASRQLSPTSRRPSVGSANPYAGTLLPPITESATLDNCADSPTCSENIMVDGGTFVVTGLVHGVQRVAEQRVAAHSQPTFVVACDPSPVRGATVACKASMSDGSEFTPTHRKSTVAGDIVVDEDLPPAPTKLYEWAGEAVAPTEVTVSATSNAGPVEKKTSFDVRTRVGADPSWDRPSFPAEPPTPTYVTGAPLSAEYPGIVPTDAGYQADEGSLGLTIFEYPNPKLKRAAAGPDKGLVFVRIPNWVPDPRSGGAPAGIYLEQSLNSSDPFYLRQTGPDPADRKHTPYCGPAEMAALSSLLARHEALHWTRAHADASAVQSAFHDTLEGFYGLPGASVSDITVALQATYKPYASAQSSAVTFVETTLPVGANAPVCVMRP